jgi:hypothetical protein
MKNHRLGIVEGSAPSEMVEEPTRIFSLRGARDMGALATWDSFALAIGKEKKTLKVMCLDLLAPYQGAARDKRP